MLWESSFADKIRLASVTQAASGKQLWQSNTATTAIFEQTTNWICIFHIAASCLRVAITCGAADVVTFGVTGIGFDQTSLIWVIDGFGNITTFVFTSTCNVFAGTKTGCVVRIISCEVCKVTVGRIKKIRVLKQLKIWPHARIFEWIGLVSDSAHWVRTNTLIVRSWACLSLDTNKV